MRNRRLKASISSRFTGPSHLRSLAESTTTQMAKTCSREPSIAARSAAPCGEGRKARPIVPSSAAWPIAAPTTAPSGPPVKKPAIPPRILPQTPNTPAR
jgi:hypothetical protein